MESRALVGDAVAIRFREAFAQSSKIGRCPRDGLAKQTDDHSAELLPVGRDVEEHPTRHLLQGLSAA